ncbi:MBL fold metallo-hydrolase [Trichothermofontia sp.]
MALVWFSSGLLSSPAQAAAATELYWYGHAAFRVTAPSGKVLLIDPWLENPINPTGKADLEQLNQVDLILITHGHGDHVGNRSSLPKKRAQN